MVQAGFAWQVRGGRMNFDIGTEIGLANAEYSITKSLALISNLRVLRVREFIEKELSESERQVLFRLLGLHKSEVIAKS